MSVQSQIDRIEQNVANTYAVLDALGADMPAEQNSDNLATTAGSAKAVLYSAQSLTDAQKVQARANIGIDEAYKAQLVQDVIDAIGCPVFGMVDGNNDIVLTSALTDGTYTIKYEMEDGSFVEVGTLTVGNGESVVIINLLESAVGATGAVLNDVGYVDGKYLSGSAAVSGNDSYLGTDAACFATGFMPYTKAQLLAKTPVYVKGVAIDRSLSHVRLGYYPSYDFATYLDPMKLSSSWFDVTELATNYYKIVPVNADGIWSELSKSITDIAYFRLSLNGSGAGVIITVGQEIPD